MNTTENNPYNKYSGKVGVGLFIILIGTALLLNNMGLKLPGWLFRWNTFLIALGLFVGFRHRFRSNGWLVMVLIGTYFTLMEALSSWNMEKIVFPVMLLFLGLFLIVRPRRQHGYGRRWRRRMDRYNRRYAGFAPGGVASGGVAPGGVAPSSVGSGAEQAGGFVPGTEQAEAGQAGGFAPGDGQPDIDERIDYLDSVNVFGGSHQTIYSKNFKGGDVVAVFGGCDVNLTQADFEGQIRMEIVAIFGGAKIIVPAGWEIKSEVTAILGGMDDKRAILPTTEDAPRKLLIITGVAIFGGIEIRNY